MTEHNTTGPRSDGFPARRAGSPDAAAPGGPADCEYASRVSAYHDGEVSDDEARELSRHIAGCPECAAQLVFFGKVSNTFEAAPRPHLGLDVRQRLEGMGDQFEPNRLRIKPSADVRWVRRLSAAAAVLFILTAGKVVYDQKLAVHNMPLTPAVTPHIDNKGPAISDAGYDVSHSVPKPPTTGQGEKP